MRSGLSTILQTLTPDAAAVVTQSISEASKRGHGQTTPLHVASSLLSSQSVILRQACVRSHPNTSHPLQCRALELCFSVALDRLPNSNSKENLQPPISNALLAALKRAQANQRRGCPEQQQQPLLAVKVEIEQLIISILDDPSVSRVMREASFSSPAVKSAVEKSVLNFEKSSVSSTLKSAGVGPPAPLLFGNQSLYLNPRLMSNDDGGESEEREEVRKALDVMLRRKERNPILVGDSDPLSLVKEVLKKIGGNQLGPEFPRRIEVISLEKKLSKFVDGALQVSLIFREFGDSVGHLIDGGAAVVLDAGDLLWLVEKSGGSFGAAVIAETKKLLDRFSGQGKIWLLGCASSATYLRLQDRHPSVELDWDLKALFTASRSPISSIPSRLSTNGALPRRTSEKTEMCSSCKDSYERELARLVAMEFEKSSSGSKPDKPLPPWLQLAKLSSDSSSTQSQTREQELCWKKTTEELIKRWSENCSRLHSSPVHAVKPKVATDLNLGCKDEHVDYDSFKRLTKGLEEKVNWQRQAAATVAAALCRRRSRGATWLLFTGPDLLGKKKMAAAVAALLFNSEPFTFSFGAAARSADSFSFSRGRTALDRVAEALRRNPASVVVLDGVDLADKLFMENLKRAMEIGRVKDSHGREVSLAGTIFILVSGGGPTEEKLLAAANSGWQLELTSPEKKRRSDLALPSCQKLPRLSLDLNLAVSVSDEDSSDITVDHDVRDSKWELLRSSVDSAVEFMPVDFEELKRKVADIVSRKFRTAAGEGMTLVIDEEVIDKFVGGMWFGSTPMTAFDEWAERVVVPSFRQLRSTGPVVKLLPLKDGGAGIGAAALPSWVRVTQ